MRPPKTTPGERDERPGSGEDVDDLGTVCWAETEERALETVLRQWPLAGMPGVLNTELATPSQFEQVAPMVTPDALQGRVVLGPDPARHLAGIEEYARAGFDHVHVHQVGTDHDGFLRFYESEVLPHVDRVLAGAGR
jgi:coenzyme F420-dependent glucose-6-phosphate dehydrogenase